MLAGQALKAQGPLIVDAAAEADERFTAGLLNSYGFAGQKTAVAIDGGERREAGCQ